MQNLQQLLRQMQGQGMGGMQGPPPDSPIVDTAEQVYISSLALLKMLKHGTFLLLSYPCNYLTFCTKDAREYPWKSWA